MESLEKSKRMRFVLPLVKCPVTEITQLVGTDKQRIKIALGGSTTMTFEVSNLADLRMGDLMTLYTEAPMKGLD